MSDMARILQTVLDKAVDGKKIFGASFALKKDGLIWEGASGNIGPGQLYFIASTTKLFTTAIVLNLRSKGLLSLDDKISRYLDQQVVNGLHVFKGNDHSAELTVRHLLSHTSGLPDYFQNKGANGKSLEDDLIGKKDQHWTFGEAIDRTKKIKPLFVPGTKGKAHYSDSNFQLLGKIIENITGKPYRENCQEGIIDPLELKNTYLYLDTADKRPKPLYYKADILDIPEAMTSFGPDGGIVSNSGDMLVFIEAFFTGKLFPAEYISGLQQWNRIFFPMQSGTGIHKFQLPLIFNPTGAVPRFIGHSGLSGALAYYCPKENLYIAGTVNQVAHPDLSFRTMIKLTQAAAKK
jgi:CubicO group peptidase (beta-lactamase class C family)